jgi:predicted GNAT superfamily acetyltransferase
MNELFVQYFKERENLETLITEHGFLCYGIIERDYEKFALLEDFFVVKSERGKGHGKQLFQTFLEAARNLSCQKLICNIFAKDPNCNQTLQLALHHGFVVIHADGGKITLLRSIEDDGK